MLGWDIFFIDSLDHILLSLLPWIRFIRTFLYPPVHKAQREIVNFVESGQTPVAPLNLFFATHAQRETTALPLALLPPTVNIH
jgi:hypothetical protein